MSNVLVLKRSAGDIQLGDQLRNILRETEEEFRLDLSLGESDLPMLIGVRATIKNSNIGGEVLTDVSYLIDAITKDGYVYIREEYHGE